MTPNTNIKILHNVPLDLSYRHTLYFADATAQANYFASKVKKNYSGYMYRRDSDDLVVRTDVGIDEFYDVNYIMYQNANYGNKWFYAFVTAVNYENAHAVSIKFKIDVIQTWFFDAELKPSYIERWTPDTDVIGWNVVPENLDIGEPVVMDSVSTNSTIFKRWAVIAITTFDWNTWNPTAGAVYGGIYSPLKRTIIGQYDITLQNSSLHVSTVVDASNAITSLVNNHAALVDGLVAVYMAPMAFHETLSPLAVAIPKPQAGDRLKPMHDSAALYVPRNKKLYTFPFTKLFVTDGSGGGKFYAFERFYASPYANFRLFSDSNNNESIVCTPTGYDGYNNFVDDAATSFNFEEAVVMTGFPVCAWISNAYQTYLAQNASSIGLSKAMAYGKVVVGGAGVALGVLGALGTGGLSTAGIAGGVSLAGSGLKDIAALNADEKDRSTRAPEMHGQMTGTALFGVAEKAFRFVTYCPDYEFCKIIDEYFDKYGYAQHRIMTVPLNARPHWTYIKTVDALVLPKSNSAGCNAAALREIEAIYDNGVTFWVNPAEVGDYTLDNSVT